MEIRAFRPCDADTVWAIQHAAYRPLYEKYLDEQTNPYLESRETVLQKYTRENTMGYLFYQDGVAVGTVRIILHPQIRRGRISALAVLPEYQGRGIAQRALREIEKIHPEITRWTLDTILQEEGNCHLYEKLGYRRTGITEAINKRMILVSYEKP